MALFERIEYGSGHGTVTGIYPRFYLQVSEIASFSEMEKDKLDTILWDFHQSVMPDFTHFYDIFHEITDMYTMYFEGLKNGQFFSKDNQGIYVHDRKLEIQIVNKIKDFFIKGRILLNNVSKSSIVKDELFDLEKLLLVKDVNFEKNRKMFLEKDPNKRYAYLFELVEQVRKGILIEFNQIRAEIEHNNFSVSRFVISTKNDVIVIKEPVLLNGLLIDKLRLYYDDILRFLEILFVFYYGIKAYFQWKGMMVLYQRKQFDSKILFHEFVVFPRTNQSDVSQLLFP